MERLYYRVTVNKIIDQDRYLFVPFGVNSKGITQSLKKFIYIDQYLDEQELGKKVLECLEMSKNFVEKDMIEETKEYLSNIKKYKLNDFDKGCLKIGFTYYIKDNKYRLIKSYKVSNKGYMNKKGDPEHILPGNATALEIGKTIRLAFTDISVDKKDR